MTFMPHTAMLLAAGFGVRMRPLTDTVPKPMLPVAGKPMIDHVLDKLVQAGVRRAVINLHYLGHVIEAYLKKRTDIEIIFSHEDAVLETGGGVKHALQHLGADPIFCINTDLVWTDSDDGSALQAMASVWDSTRMDSLLLLAPLKTAIGFEPDRGDYFLDDEGHAYGRQIPPPRPYVFIGTQIVKPQLYAPISDAKFSNLVIFDAAEAAKRLYGIVHKGGAYHSGTPADLEHVNRLLGA